MSFGKNLQFLRRMHNGMTQEELAEKMDVSRQAISRWELDETYPEMGKVLELCRFFSCSMDELVRGDMLACDGPYSNIRTESVPPFSYVQYAVVSADPESDAITRMERLARAQGVDKPEIIGWDFPFVSQEQVNVFHMHGYAAAWILPEGVGLPEGLAVHRQECQKYAVITICSPFNDPFRTIPNAYKTLMAYMQVNGMAHLDEKEKNIIGCYEKEYERDGETYMDIYIAVK
jgi:transcriptional regulator with XRE-family HTH domain